MTVRAAKFTNIPRLVELVKQAHARSRYTHGIEVDIEHTKQWLMGCIQRHDGKGEGATFVLVSVDGDMIEGFIVGLAARIQEVLDKLYVTDWMFYTSPVAPARDALTMLRMVTDWGTDNPKVAEVTFGATDVIGDYAPTTVLYRRIGLEQRGVIYGGWT